WGKTIPMPSSPKKSNEAKRRPKYTAKAESLRKPALASVTLRADCSNSVCGISGLDNLLAVSTTPFMRSSFSTDCWVSMSTSDAGRLMRARRSCARTLRWEIIDSTAQHAAMKAAKIKNGMMSASPITAKITMATPCYSCPLICPCGWNEGLTAQANQESKNQKHLDFDVDDLLDHQGP